VHRLLLGVWRARSCTALQTKWTGQSALLTRCSWFKKRLERGSLPQNLIKNTRIVFYTSQDRSQLKALAFRSQLTSRSAKIAAWSLRMLLGAQLDFITINKFHRCTENWTVISRLKVYTTNLSVSRWMQQKVVCNCLSEDLNEWYNDSAHMRYSFTTWAILSVPAVHVYIQFMNEWLWVQRTLRRTWFNSNLILLLYLITFLIMINMIEYYYSIKLNYQYW